MSQTRNPISPATPTAPTTVAKSPSITSPPAARPPAPAPTTREASIPKPSSVKANIEGKPARIEPTHRAIEEAAYFLWLERGGDDVLNWLEAERTVRSSTTGTTR